MKCPICNELMQAGKSSIMGTNLGFLLRGASVEHLYFKPENGKEVKVLKSRSETPSMRCNNCGAVILNVYSNSDFSISDFEETTRIYLAEILNAFTSETKFHEYFNQNEDLKHIKTEWEMHYIPNQKGFVDSFSPHELDKLNEFNSVLIDEIRNFPLNTKVEEFTKSDNWVLIEQEVKSCLELLDK